MSQDMRIDDPVVVPDWAEERRILAECIRAQASPGRQLDILEAGCGKSWGLNLGEVRYSLTGIDMDKDALEYRLNVKKDLNAVICGDLRSVDLRDGAFDVVFNSYVLEHIEGARDVLLRFERWLRPGGVMILIIPNRDSVWGLLVRMTPFWFHVMFKKHVLRDRLAGTPGHGPFRTYYDEAVSHRGIRAHCRERGLELVAEYSVGHGRKYWKPVVRLARSVLMSAIHLASLGRLSRKHANLMFIIRKPAETTNI